MDCRPRKPLYGYGVMKIVAPFLFSVAFVALIGCQSVERRSLVGDWKLSKQDSPEVVMVLNADQSFHVDVHGDKDIEIEGRYRAASGEITFINEKGSDEIASDPAPGEYIYKVTGETLEFAKISDPLERRAKFLSMPWTRVTGK